MNINELNSLKLSDYTKFHDVLNPKLWTKNHELQPDVKTALLAIAEDFKTFLGVSDFNLKDITMSGSNAGYNYNPTSDIDLHLVVDLPEVDISEVYRELFDAKKYQYNDVHDIKIHGADVELYVQNANQPHHSQGIYSLLNDKWIIFPKKIKTEIDDVSVVSKYLDLKARIESALDSDDITVSENLLKKIKNMRVDGLAQHGEFGVENLTFKLLRSEGLIGQLRDHRTKLHDQELSLLERGRKKNKKRRRYAYGGFWYPGYSFGSSEGSAGGESGESIFEGQDKKNSLAEFAVEIIRELGITNIPKVLLHKDKSWTEKTGSFGRFDPEANVLHLATADRHILDILRTMAHELVHCAQRHRGKLPPDAGETGSAYEDEANALAGRIMRGFAERRPELFRGIQLESSGYIPTEAEKNDPRFSTALTVDVQPGETGRQANKLGLQTDSQGHPALLRPGKKTQLAESRSKVKAEEDWHPNDRPPGPEIKPTMPRGTVRVDVSDIYDWYKLGKQISNLDQADPTQFGKGPPSTIVSFGDEDTEHKYLQGLDKLGLTTTDLDPVDPNQPAGMRLQKTDPTYNVNEVSNPRYKFLRPGELTGSYTDQQLRDLGFKKSQNGTWFIAWDQWNRLTDPKNPKIKEDLDQPSDLPSINLAKQNLNKILAAAQRIYDNWNESEVDTYAGGGICHLIADAICDVMWDMNIECTTVSCSYEQHVYVAVKVEEGVYTIDIPYGIYEEGGGFSWKKIPDIKFEPKNVVFYKVSGDPKEFDNYTALEENKIVKKKIISGNKSQSNILTIQGVDDNLLSEKVQELIDQGKSSDKAIKQIAYEFELPEQKISKAFYSVAEGLNNVPSTLYHATYRPLLKSIKQHGLGGDKAQSKWEDSKPGVVYLALDKNVAESYAETSDVVPDDWIDKIIILKISTAGLDPNKFNIDSNVQDNEGDTLEYHGIIPVSNIKIVKQGVAEGNNNLNFEEGDCPIFAIALHRLSKLPLMALVEYDEEMGSTVLIHAYVKLNDEWRVDASGETNVPYMLAKFPNNGAAEEVQISEKDLIKLGYEKNKCPSLSEVLPYAKKILQDIEQGVAEGSQEINWVKPNFDFEWHEVEEQSRMKQVPVDVRQYYQKHFPNKDAWLKAVQNGKAVVVPPDHTYEIRNAPFDKASLQKVLAPTGHEGPIGPAKEKRVNDLFDKGQVEMPIILKTSQGLWLIGGKTRLGTANYVKGLPAKVWLISGEQGVAESEKALQFATQAHLGQTRSGGEPYITHPMRVAEIVKKYKQSHNIEALIDAALLHDTLEDTDTTHEALKDLFGGLTASLVKELTSDLEKIKEVGKSKYLANKMAHELTSWALVIKLADRLDNVQDIATAKTPEWRARYKKETEDMLSYLELNRELSGTHQRLIDAIRKKLDEVSDQQGVAEGAIKDLDIDLLDQQWEAIVGYVINSLKKNMDIGRIELNLYKYAGREMFDVDQALEDHGFESIADLADHIRQNNGRYVPPTDFGLTDLAESLRIDVPNENWLQGKIDYAKKKGRDRFGAPYFNATTAYFTDDVRVPIQVLRKLSGMRGEQQNVRQNDLAAIKKILKDTGKLPLGRDGKEYVPFVMVAHNGEAWVNEGNHRIMAAAELYDEGDMRFASLPVELKYFDGGERIKDGPLYPSKIGFGNQGVVEGELVESLRREFELLKNEFIGEIKMSPSNLRAEVAKIPGALAGMEFEMIVPGVSNADDNEYVPDYSDNPRPNSIDDIEEFFHDGDFNGRNTINRLVTELNESWIEWVASNFESVWQNNQDAYLYNFVRNELDPEITAELLGFDSDNRPDGFTRNQLRGFTRNQLRQAVDTILTNSDDNRRYEELIDEAYQYALNAYIEGGNQRDWLTSLGIESMSNVPVEFSVVNWPYWTNIANEQMSSIEDIALNFMKSIGQNTVAMSESYHGEYSKWDGSDWQAVGRTKPQDCYTVEPDGSLRPPNDNYFGLEFVSPPMPVDDMVRDLNAVRKWAQSVGAKTGPNYQTGLHINVSVPELSDSDNLDFVKLALLVGDQYVLNQFGRSSNGYARSALDLVRDRVRDRPDVAKSLLDRMKGHLQKLASRALHSGEVSKRTSIHPKDGYIEFRSPGGDWLDEDFDKIEDTLMRFVVSTQAAVDPEAYREEYLDRLYKLLTGQSYGRDPQTGDLEWQVTSKKETPYQDTRTLKSGQTVSTTKHKPEFETTVTASSAQQAWNQVKSQLSPDAQASDFTVKRAMTDSGDKDLLKFFAQYSAGKLPETALRSFIKQAQLQREIERKQTTGQRYWWKVYRDREGEPNTAVIEVVAANKKQAIEKAAAEWGVFSREYISRITAEPVRPYVEPLPDPNAPVLNGRPSNPDGNFYIASSQDTNTPLYRFMATTDSDARFVLDQWQRLYGRDFVYRLDNLQRRGQPRSTQVPNTSTSVPSRQTDIENMLALGSQAADANWEIVDRSNYQPVFLFIANTPQDARRVYERWLTAWGYDQDTEDYGFRERARPGSTLDIQRQRAEQSARAAVQSTGNILWQIVDSADGQVAYEFYLSAENNQQDANEVGMRWVRNNGNPYTSYSVRAQPQQTGTVQPQNQEGSVQWRILVGGEEVHRFWNRSNQGEANAAARTWIQDQIRRGLLSPAEGAEVEVVPVMGNRT